MKEQLTSTTIYREQPVSEKDAIFARYYEHLIVLGEPGREWAEDYLRRELLELEAKHKREHP